MNNIDILEEKEKRLGAYLAVLNEENIFYKKEDAIEGIIKFFKTLIAENKKLKEENLELLTRLRADGLIDRDKYWINKIKEAIYKGTLEAKGWDCEDGAYCVEKEFQKLLGKE